MADPATEKLQNMNIQDFEGSEFDPYSSQNKTQNIPNSSQGIDLLGELTNGHDRGVSFEHEEGLGLPDPYYTGQDPQNRQRNMSDGEILGYQDPYGENRQHEYMCESSEDELEPDNLIDIGASQNAPQRFPGSGPHGDQEYYMQTGQPLVDFNDVQALPLVNQQSMDDFMLDNPGGFSDQDPSQVQNQKIYDDGETGETDYYNEGSNVDSQQQQYEEDDINEDDTDLLDPGSWHPQTDPERARRSRSPERSMSPNASNSKSEGAGVASPQGDTEDISSMSEMSQQEMYSRESEPRSDIPRSGSQASEESQSLRSAPSETGSQSPRIGHTGIPRPSSDYKKSRMKKPIELPPWDDNVVIPKPPRMKPTMVGKQADLPPSPKSPHRSKTAPANNFRIDASSDSGVEEDKTAKSPRKNSADIKKKYGTDTNNPKYKPGGGDVKLSTHAKLDTRSVKPRTDSSTPKGVFSPSHTPKRVKSPTLPSPNVQNVHSKIGSLQNVQHSPGGGNITVLSSKADFSNVSSKVGSKDKIHHKPKGGDKKILNEKVEFKAQSKVGSTANIKHRPGGGDKKIETQKLEFKDTAKAKIGSMDKVTHKPGGGDIKILDEKVDFTAAAPKVGSLDKVKHQPGGGDKKIETQKLSFKETAKPRTNTGVGSGGRRTSHDSEHSRSESVTSQDDNVEG